MKQLSDDLHRFVHRGVPVRISLNGGIGERECLELPADLIVQREVAELVVLTVCRELDLSNTCWSGRSGELMPESTHQGFRVGVTPMQLVVHHEVRDEAVVVHIKGEIDMPVVDEFRSDLRLGMNTASTDSVRLLIIDLQDVAFFGSAGLNAVLECFNDGRANGIAVRLVATNPVVVRVFELTKLDKALALYPSLGEALQVRDAQKL